MYELQAAGIHELPDPFSHAAHRTSRCGRKATLRTLLPFVTLAGAQLQKSAPLAPTRAVIATASVGPMPCWSEEYAAVQFANMKYRSMESRYAWYLKKKKKKFMNESVPKRIGFTGKKNTKPDGPVVGLADNGIVAVVGAEQGLRKRVTQSSDLALQVDVRGIELSRIHVLEIGRVVGHGLEYESRMSTGHVLRTADHEIEADSVLGGGPYSARLRLEKSAAMRVKDMGEKNMVEGKQPLADGAHLVKIVSSRHNISQSEDPRHAKESLLCFLKVCLMHRQAISVHAS